MKKIYFLLIAVLIIGVFLSSRAKEILKLSLFNESRIGVCKNIPNLNDGELKLVTKVIDGDTFLIEGGYIVRILGIDADEKGYPCYEVSKIALENLILGKKVELKKGKEDFDKYCRYLRHVFMDGKNIAVELVKNGLVVSRFTSDKKYFEEILASENEARENNRGCKWGGGLVNVYEDKNSKFGNLEGDLKTKIIDACSSKDYIGKEVIVEGKIVSIYHSLKSNTIFLNFERPYPEQCLAAVIFSSYLSNFPKNLENFYLNKKVRIFGEIKEYKNRPQIFLKKLDQIRLVNN